MCTLVPYKSIHFRRVPLTDELAVRASTGPLDACYPPILIGSPLVDAFVLRSLSALLDIALIRRRTLLPKAPIATPSGRIRISNVCRAMGLRKQCLVLRCEAVVLCSIRGPKHTVAVLFLCYRRGVLKIARSVRSCRGPQYAA